MTQPLSVADATDAYKAAVADTYSKLSAASAAQAAVDEANSALAQARIAQAAAQADLVAAFAAAAGDSQ